MSDIDRGHSFRKRSDGQKRDLRIRAIGLMKLGKGKSHSNACRILLLTSTRDYMRGVRQRRVRHPEGSRQAIRGMQLNRHAYHSCF